jgi:hypothetical protein
MAVWSEGRTGGRPSGGGRRTGALGAQGGADSYEPRENDAAAHHGSSPPPHGGAAAATVLDLHSPATTAVLERLFTALHADSDKVVQSLIRLVRRMVPEYGGVTSPVEQDAIASGMARIFHLGLAVLREERPISADEVKILRAIGAQRAAQGLPAGSVTRTFRVAIAGVWDHVGHLAIKLPPSAAKEEALTSLGARLLWLSDEACLHMEAGHADAEGGRGRTREQRHGEFVGDLLQGRIDSAEAIRRRAREVGYPISERQAVVLVCGARTGRASDQELRGFAAGFLRTRRGGLYKGDAGDDAPHVVLVLPIGEDHEWDGTVEDIEALARDRGLTCLLHEPVVASGVARVYVQLRSVVEPARCVYRAQAVPWSKVQFLRVLTQDLDELRAFALDHLGRLLEQPAKTLRSLLDVLEALYVTQCPPSKTDLAARLHVHRETVANRLRQIHELTGLDAEIDGGTLQLAYIAHLLTAGRA